MWAQFSLAFRRLKVTFGPHLVLDIEKLWNTFRVSSRPSKTLKQLQSIASYNVCMSYLILICTMYILFVILLNLYLLVGCDGGYSHVPQRDGSLILRHRQSRHPYSLWVTCRLACSSNQKSTNYHTYKYTNKNTNTNTSSNIVTPP